MRPISQCPCSTTPDPIPEKPSPQALNIHSLAEAGPVLRPMMQYVNTDDTRHSDPICQILKG
eukprot:2524590-Alexandrium_andersonii.AAC.1